MTTTTSIMIGVDTYVARPRPTIYEEEEERQKRIAAFVKDRKPMRVGKTRRDRTSGYYQRHADRRSSHESWMRETAQQPSNKRQHPFEKNSS